MSTIEDAWNAFIGHTVGDKTVETWITDLAKMADETRDLVDSIVRVLETSRIENQDYMDGLGTASGLNQIATILETGGHLLANARSRYTRISAIYQALEGAWKSFAYDYAGDSGAKAPPQWATEDMFSARTLSRVGMNLSSLNGAIIGLESMLQRLETAGSLRQSSAKLLASLSGE